MAEKKPEKKPTTLDAVGGIVYAIIGEELEPITPENEKKNLVDDLGAESLGLTEIILNIEEQLGIEIPDDDMMTKITTPWEAATYAKQAVEAGKSTKFFL